MPSKRTGKENGETAAKTPAKRSRSNKADRGATPVGKAKTAEAKPAAKKPATRSTRPRARAASNAPASAAGQPVSSQDIATRAYYIWEAEGRPSGLDQAHWLRAEAELQGPAPA